MPLKSKPKTETKVRKSRSPNGVVSDKPIPARFMPDELERVNQVADKEQRTAASIVRLATLRGLAEYDKDPLAFTKSS
jgi:hypothetical protein